MFRAIRFRIRGIAFRVQDLGCMVLGFRVLAAVYAAKQTFGPVVRTGACLLQLVGHRGRRGRLCAGLEVRPVSEVLFEM